MDSYVTSGDVDQVGASGSGFSCFIAGNAMMTRKDSAFNALWNQGFSRLRANGDFKKLCDEGRTKHGKYSSWYMLYKSNPAICLNS